MSDPNLRNLLSELHARLGKRESIDPADRKLLATALRDISQALARSEPASSPNRPRLEALAVKFEADHPALAETLRQLIDALAKAGI